MTDILQIESICVNPCKSVFAYARTRCQRCFDSETGFFFAISDIRANRISLRQSVHFSVCVCENMICQRCFDSETEGSSLRSVTNILQIESICVNPCKSVFANARTRCQRCFDSETGFFFAISDIRANRISLRQSVHFSVCVCENMICQRCFDSETEGSSLRSVTYVL
jgi:uncharacterized protein YjaG (DUF416 family)